MNPHLHMALAQARQDDLRRAATKPRPADPSDAVVVDARRLRRLGSRVLVLRGPLPTTMPTAEQLRRTV
jgi:hypothetical protein